MSNHYFLLGCFKNFVLLWQLLQFPNLTLFQPMKFSSSFSTTIFQRILILFSLDFTSHTTTQSKQENTQNNGIKQHILVCFKNVFYFLYCKWKCEYLLQRQIFHTIYVYIYSYYLHSINRKCTLLHLLIIGFILLAIIITSTKLSYQCIRLLKKF